MEKEIAPRSGNLRAYQSDLSKIKELRRGSQTQPDIIRMLLDFYLKANKKKLEKERL